MRMGIEMEKLRLSKYNVFNKLSDGTLLIYNTLHRKIIKVPIDKADIIESFETHNTTIDEKDKQLLLKYGVMVEENTDEKKYADFLFHKTIFSSDFLELTILPTNDCNFNCIYCYQNERKNYMTKKTADSIIRYIEKSIKKNVHVLSIGWFGGEPLLSVDIITYVMNQVKELCKKNHVILLSRMTTNGYYLTLENFKNLIHSGVRYFQVTIDGNKRIHNYQRPLKNSASNDSYDVVLNNLIEIQSFRGFFEMGIRINITPAMLAYKEEILKTMASSFTDKRYTMLFEWVRDWGGEKVQEHLNSVGNAKTVIDWIQLAKFYGLNCANKLTTEWNTYFCESCKLNGFIIDWDGLVYKCAMAIYKEDFSCENRIGIIDDNGNLQKNELKIAKWIMKNEKNECADCIYYPLCFNFTCPFKSNIKQEKACLPFKDLIKEYMKINDQQNAIITME